MNFLELKRPELQKLCKTHGIKANGTNVEMREQLTKLQLAGGDIAPSNNCDTAFDQRSDSDIFMQLKDVFLSPTCCTDKVDQKQQQEQENEPRVLDDEALQQLLEQQVPDINSMMDRLGQVPVSQYIISTYHNGLPLYNQNPMLQIHLIRSLRTVVAAVAAGAAPLGGGLPVLPGRAGPGHRRVVRPDRGAGPGAARPTSGAGGPGEAGGPGRAGKCPASNAWRTGDENPYGQLPHLQNRYRLALGGTVGLRGVAAAAQDHLASPLADPAQVEEALEQYRALFSAEDVALTLVRDVNQQDLNAERLIDRDTLAKWASEQAPPSFNAHSIFFNEESNDEHDYLGEEPREENTYHPFLSKQVALSILSLLFLSETEQNEEQEFIERTSSSTS
eukprot:CAMPEP_0206410272 /NCGR_PEP_ID=MMETSP0294-20121207/32485_1 /ASSEMBLY_ACC=CAM_ASM_000327 /TAXON_ID=39354 /ORGANISM="Heterosigma akashiwo, Strain CCMP2393" /LENGTH=389 /DNA_ID=CAMNT_0053870569 /DNA_START=231 /DNA_END=1401 /DNA_ORIENTATION=-